MFQLGDVAFRRRHQSCHNVLPAHKRAIAAWQGNPETLFPLALHADRYTICYVWAAAGSVDTDLRFFSVLKLYRTDVAERRMAAPAVVRLLDEVEYVCA